MTDPTLPTIPKIGQPWLHANGVAIGTYLGVARAEGDWPDSHLVLLTADGPALSWEEGKAWAEEMGEGAHMPTRDESALHYANARETADDSRWYWTSTQCSDDCAYNQNFGNGTQSSSFKSAKAWCRAVRRFPV